MKDGTVYYQNVELHNIRAVMDLPGGGIAMSRVPQAVRSSLNELAKDMALNGSGCEIRFNLDGEHATVWLQRSPAILGDPYGVAEVWFGPFQGPYELCPRIVKPEPTAITVSPPVQLAALERLAVAHNLSFDPNLVRIVLPYDIASYLLGIEGCVSPPRPDQTPRRRLLAYGSSISHGGSAVAPTQTFAMHVARELGYDLLNLGFSGSAWLEAEMADYIADDLEWDVATLELGINVLRQWTVDEFARKVQYFVPRIAHRHTDKWIFCTDILTVGGDTAALPQLDGFRAVVRDTVAALDLPRLVYVDGRTLLTEPTGLTSDLVHPSSAGATLIAANLSRLLSQALSSTQANN